MNKKALAALVGTLAFGTATVTAYAGDAPAKEDKTPAPKKGKDDKKKGGKDASCNGDKGCNAKKDAPK